MDLCDGFHGKNWLDIYCGFHLSDWRNPFVINQKLQY